MQEAESKLPSGFVVVNPKNPPPKGVGIQRFSFPTNYQIEFAVRGDSNEGYTFESVNGKIAYISRVVYLPKGTEVDYNVYRSQLFQKYGPESKEILRQYISTDPRGPQPDVLHWSWNNSGHQDPGYISFPGQMQFDGTAFFQLHQASFGDRVFAKQFPTAPNTPGASVALTIEPVRAQTDIPLGQVDKITFKLIDYRPFIADSLQAAAAQHKKEQDAADAVKKHSGPPL